MKDDKLQLDVVALQGLLTKHLEYFATHTDLRVSDEMENCLLSQSNSLTKAQADAAAMKEAAEEQTKKIVSDADMNACEEILNAYGYARR